MKRMLICFFVCAIASAFYTDIDERVDLYELDHNTKEMKVFMDCLIDKGPCNETMNSYKRHTAESVQNACTNCSPVQKHVSEHFLKTASIKFPKEMKLFKEKYDPKGIYFKAFNNEIAKY